MIAPIHPSSGPGLTFMAKKKRETFGAIVVRLREAAGLSQYALAKKAGMSQQTLSYLESQDREPNWSSVQRIARALGVSCEVFYDPTIELPDYKPGKPGPKPKGGPAGVKRTRRPKGGE